MHIYKHRLVDHQSKNEWQQQQLEYGLWSCEQQEQKPPHNYDHLIVGNPEKLDELYRLEQTGTTLEQHRGAPLALGCRGRRVAPGHDLN